MLQTQTTPRETFQLLERLMLDGYLNDFNLAGGTALAFYMGHRKSVDLALFNQNEFNETDLERYLIEKYNFISNYKDKNTLKGNIDGVKIDCITSFSRLCKPIRNDENIRLYSPEDIIAMKLLAIVDNGTRLKDFVDISYLSAHYSLNEMIEFAHEKFPNKNQIMFEKAISYQGDIIHEKIELMKGEYNWKSIENRLKNMVQNQNQLFSEDPIQKNTIKYGRKRF